MNYREKLKAFEEGTLNEEEAREIEKDLEKFEAMRAFFTDSKVQAAPVAEENGENYTKAINKAVNRKINSAVLRTVFTGILFAFLFVFGLSAQWLSQKLGGGSLTEFFLNGTYSIVFIPTVVYMLYRMFYKKETAPAVILLIWNIVPVIITFIVSSVIGDAFAVFLPAYYGFAYLPMAISYLVTNGSFDGVGALFGIGGMVISCVLSVVALILRKKELPTKLHVQKIGKKAVAVLLAVYVVLGSGLLTGSAFMQINDGLFPDERVGSEAVKAQLSEVYNTVLVPDLTGKSLEDADKIFDDAGFEKTFYTEGQEWYHRYTLNKNIATVEMKNNAGNTVNAYTVYTPYVCRYVYVSIEKLQNFGKAYMGKTQETVLGDLGSFAMYPRFVSVLSENGKTTAEYQYDIDIPATEYHFRYTETLHLTFVNGVLTACDNNAF